MTVAQYKIWARGVPVGQGATQSVHVGVAAIAKRNLSHQPYIVPNELICAQLAAACRLPVPPGFIVQHEGESAFVSMNLNLAGENLPPANVSAFVTAQPWLAWGIVLLALFAVAVDFDTATPSTREDKHARHGLPAASGVRGQAVHDADRAPKRRVEGRPRSQAGRDDQLLHRCGR